MVNVMIRARNRVRSYFYISVSTCMGARRHGQEGALAPSGNVVKCFCALVVTAKRSVDELFMQYFHNLPSASGVKGAQTPTGAISLDPLGVLSSPDP